MNIFKKIVQHLKYKIWLNYHVVVPQFFYSLKLGKRIQHGPFKGIIYNLSSIGSVLTPKLIGTYEHELSDYFNSSFLNSYELFVDIGAAEGYYVVGVRFLNKNLEIIAFETELKGQLQIKKNLSINQLWDKEKVKINGICNHEDLIVLLSKKKKTFILCDIEGYEKTLLNPDKIPTLNTCDLLVELHNDICPNIEEIIRKRFTSSHYITKINKEEKNGLKKNYQDKFILKNFDQLSNEFRKKESWLFLKMK